MSLPVSKRLGRTRPSPTGEALALAARLQAAGHDIIGLGVGEPDFDTPQAIRDAAIAAIRGGATRYTPIAGTPALRAAVRRKFARDNGLEFDNEQIVVTAGAKQAVFSLCLAVLDPGTEAVIPAPYWVSYPDIVALCGAEPVIVPAGIDADFKVTPARLAGAMSDRTRLVVLNSPCNPTGAAYTADELAALGSVIERFPDVVVAADEIYEHIYWGPEPYTSFAAACPQLADRVVTINGVSKAYAMTGWRIGFAAGPRALIEAMITLQSQSTTNPSSVSQAAAVAALDGEQAPVADMCRAFRDRHDLVVSGLDALPGFECRPGEGTFYAFPRVTGAIEALGLADDTEFTKHLLESAGVAVVPGSAFGAPGHVRLSFACARETLEVALARIAGCLPA
ncbi:MAG: pyridoxal phosphate-dependent aminotransferase [Woeseiaceae bacterium]|nr:pyridoxal phosphate-dependent aminotransferase [Woeseiaceae bacterium]